MRGVPLIGVWYEKNEGCGKLWPPAGIHMRPDTHRKPPLTHDSKSPHTSDVCFAYEDVRFAHAVFRHESPGLYDPNLTLCLISLFFEIRN